MQGIISMTSLVTVRCGKEHTWVCIYLRSRISPLETPAPTHSPCWRDRPGWSWFDQSTLSSSRPRIISWGGHWTWAGSQHLLTFGWRNWVNLLWRAKQEGHINLEIEPVAWWTTMGAAHVDREAEKRVLAAPEKRCGPPGAALLILWYFSVTS